MTDWRYNLELGEKFRASLQMVFDAHVEQASADAAAYEVVESPIEALFLIAFWVIDNITSDPGAGWIEIRAQQQIGTHRVDFVVWQHSFDHRHQPIAVPVIVECDGRDHHYSTWEQIEADRRRDAELDAAGFKVFRFPGTQIYNDPASCVEKVLDWLDYLSAEERRRKRDGAAV